MRFISLVIVWVFAMEVHSNSVPATSTNFISSLMGSFRGDNAMNVTQLMSTLQMPLCLRQCMPQMDTMFSLAKKQTDQPEVIADLCKHLQSSSKCAEAAGCSTVYLDAAAQAFQFVCIENIESFGDSLECVKAAAGDLQPECEAHCGVQAKILDDASSNRLENIFEMDSVCNSTVCLLHCFKDRINSKCMGQSNLVETLIGSMLRGDGHGFEQVMSWMTPAGCTKNINITSPKEVEPGQPMSVGGRKNLVARQADVRSMDRPIPSVSPNTDAIEAALIVDGEVRTLQCSMADWQGNRVVMPTFENLAKIMTAQLLPFSFPEDRPLSIPSNRNVIEAEERVEEKLKEGVSHPKQEKDMPTWRGDRTDLVVPENSVGIATGLLVFVVSVGIWVWEALQEF